MSNQKILYVTTEMFPYQEESNIAVTVNKMALKMHQSGNDVRVFMPKFGSISERKFQLHEVIRLSGMNIIINDLDQPLIIKVASLPGERLQVYFIDNEEYFKRKPFYQDEDGTAFEDNGERAVFFARGVVETIKKLNWVPDVIHINGWMSSMIPIYLKTFYKNDYYFKNTKIVLSLYNETDIEMSETTKEVLDFDNIKEISALEKPSTQKMVIESINYSDIVLRGDEFLEGDLKVAYDNTKTEKGDFVEPELIGKVY
ncbi:MAG: glycogen/starch synthase [Cruoricaptor ignavus]|nr:glycogen/starch synthase [Cruoricaptor ignavus]